MSKPSIRPLLIILLIAAAAVLGVLTHPLLIIA